MSKHSDLYTILVEIADKKVVCTTKLFGLKLFSENCPRFLCKGEPCEDRDSQSCTSKLKVCIDKSLQCNDAPNCGYSDKSDEEKCK